MKEPFLDQFFMQEALKQAQMAYEDDEVPVGAVITFQDKMLAVNFEKYLKSGSGFAFLKKRFLKTLLNT